MALVLALCFGRPLWDLTLLASTGESKDFYSYILLIPFISGYLLWINRRNLILVSPPARLAAAGFLAAGILLLAAYWLGFRSQLVHEEGGALAVLILDFLLFLAGAGCLILGARTMRAAAFPLSFLIFFVPIPATIINNIDTVLQLGSAAMAWAFFKLSGTPFIADGLVFQLPGITIRIAPECSGIRSSVILFITSLLASYLFLRTPWKRTVLVLIVIPLGILRNGFRVFVIGELCVHIGPYMINSPIHHKGGPIFFVLSLIPLFIILLVLQRSERAGAGAKSPGLSIHHA